MEKKVSKKIKKNTIKKYRVTNLEDANEEWDLKAGNLLDAVLQALEELGWGICEIED